MSSNQQSAQQKLEAGRAPGTQGFSRLLLLILAVVAILALGANVAWWFSRPTLEPLPFASNERLEPEIRELIEVAVTNVSTDGNSAAAWGDLGAVYYAHAFEAQAQICFRNAERLDPQDFRWPYLLAACLTFTDRDQMLAAYRRAAQRCGERAHVQLKLAEILLERGELEEAAVQIERVLAYAPSSARAQFAKAQLLFAEGKLEEAKSWAERSTENAEDKHAPYMRAPYMLLAQVCRRTHDAAGEARAVAALRQTSEAFSSWEDPELAAVVSLSRSRARSLAKAEELALRGHSAKATGILYEMTKGNDGSSAAEALARTLNRDGQCREAEALLRHQLLSSPQDERLYYQLGAACYQQGKYPEAEAAFRRVTELKPDYASAWHNLGMTQVMLGKSVASREALTAALRLNPGEVSSRLKLAELLLADGKQDEAREHLEAALKVDPQQAQAREMLARVKAGGK